jgi:PRTRC genetic system ThiF family protein
MSKYLTWSYYKEWGLYLIERIQSLIVSRRTVRQIVRAITPPPKTYKVNIGEPGRVVILLVGAGGTGGYVAQILGQLGCWAQVAGLSLHLVFVDPDVVEAKNIVRQNFCEAELGLYKARTLAWRYSHAYNVQITAVSEKFSAEMLERFRPESSPQGTLTIVVGAVDNWQARRDMAEAIEAAIRQRGPQSTDRIWWLDAGNERDFGQVLIGNSLAAEPQLSPLGFCVALPLPHRQDVTLVQSRPPKKEALGCAELTLLGEQSAMINKMMAAWVGVYLYKLLQGKDLTMMATYVDLVRGAVKSEPISRGKTIRLHASGPARPPAADGQAQPALEPEQLTCPNCPDRPLIEGVDDLDGVRITVLFCENCNFRHQACPQCRHEVERRDMPVPGGGVAPAIVCTECHWHQFVPEPAGAPDG